MSKNIILTGATGLIGTHLFYKLKNEGNHLTIFTRNVEKTKKILTDADNYVEYNYNFPETWQSYINGTDVVIHLAGSNLASKRWNNKVKKEIYDSRIISTRNIVRAITECRKKPKLLITASAVGIYGDRGEELLSEMNPPGNDFLSNLCSDWENEAKKVEESGVRRVTLRIGLVFAKDGGALKRFLLPFKLFLGGPLGSGKQWFPWIHISDLMNIFIHTIKNESLEGPVNCTAPDMITMNEFAMTLGKVLHRPALLRVPKFILKLILGEISDSLVSSQKISAEKLLDSGFNFKFYNLDSALADLLKE